MKDYYAILGVEHGADEAAIRTAYGAFLQNERTTGELPSGASSNDIDEAFAVLKDPVKRKAYDGVCAALEAQPSRWDIPPSQAQPMSSSAPPPPVANRPVSPPPEQWSTAPRKPSGPGRGFNEHLYGKPAPSSIWDKALSYGTSLIGITGAISTIMGWIVGGGTLVVMLVVAGAVYWMWPKSTPRVYQPVAHERPQPFHSAVVRTPAQTQGPRLQMASPYANVQRLMQEAFSENKEMRELALAQIESHADGRLGNHAESAELLDKGRAAASRNDDRTAVQFLGRATQVDPSNVDAWATYIEVEARAGQLTNAETLALRALSARPRSEKLWTVASTLYQQEGRQDLAIIALTNSVLLSTDPATAARRLTTDTATLERSGLQNIVQATLAKPSVKAILAPAGGPSALQNPETRNERRP